MDVLVIRHAIALDKDEAKGMGMPDRDRPLTKDGRSRMKRAVRGLLTRVPEVSAFLTSPLCRALETAEILREEYAGAPPTVTDALLPEADPSELVRVLVDGLFESPVAVVGHEPHLSYWIGWCVMGEQRGTSGPSTTLDELHPILELRKGGACLLRFDGAPGPGRGRILWLLTPAVLRRL